MSVFKRGKSKIWQVEFVLRGTRIKRSLPEARTKEQAQQVETQLKQAIFDGRYSEACATTRFADFVRKVYAPQAALERKHFEREAHRVNSLINYFGNRTMNDISPMQVERFKQEFLKQPKLNKEPRSHASVNRALGLLKRIMKIISLSFAK